MTGNKKIEKDAILAKVKSKAGDQARRNAIADDIKAVHSLGYFDDVAVDYESGVLTFSVKERPTIVKIDFEGNDQISNKDLQDVIKLKEYSILDVNKVKEDISLIQKHYEEKGFYLARVSYETKPTAKPDEVELIYRVSDFDKVRIKKITFLNNHSFSDDRLKGVLRNTKEGNFFSWISSSGNFKESAFKQDLQILTYFYLNEGYVKFRYEQPIVTVSEDKKWLFVSIYVDEGQRYNVGEIDFSGDLLYDKKELGEATQMTTGQIFSIQKRNDDIQRLTEKYQDLGYAFVNVNPKMNIHDDSRTVDIRYDFEKGNLTHFGEINVLGNSKTRDKVIRRELRIREGELYNGTRLRVSRERVERLGYFAPGEVVFNSVTRKDKKDVVDIEINVKERSTGTVTVGMGYGSIQKFFLTTQIAEINLFGRGQNLSLAGQYASDRVSRSLSLGFTEPYLFDSLWSAGVDVFLVSFPIPNKYLEFKDGFDFKFGHPLEDDLYVYTTYKFEHLTLDQINYSVDPNLQVGDDVGNMSSVGVSFVRDKRNNRFETSKGNYESVSTELAGVGANKNFAKFIGEGRFYHPITEDLTFRTKLEIGHTLKTTDKNVPPSEKFYLGGPNNLKGYDTFTVSPKDAADIPLGGASELLYIAELEIPLIKEAGVKMVFFYDMGNSYATFHDLVNVTSLKKDVGFGFRWFSPIGPLRFEWGFPIKPVGNEGNVVFNFFIGPPF
ncbi:MAG: outer membrane protein assembly factor BamA [Deltaproteobacteria bacterium]|nr:outer membrane protein assembly factor BamA [Deltaproteobacteria bacterium]